LRLQGIGASEAAVLLGCSPWGSELGLYTEKVTGEGRDLSEVEAVQWGIKLEPVVLQAYAERTERGARSDGRLLRSLRYPWAQCTLDGWTWGDDPNDTWPLEIKTTSAFMADDWAEGPPEYYNAQLHHQMLVTGAKRATIACLIGGQQMVWCDVERDDVLIRKLIKRGSEFWSRVERREPPEPDETKDAARALGKLYKEDSGETVALSSSLQDIVEKRAELKQEIKSAESELTLIENQLKAALGPAKKGELASGWSVSWSTQTRKGYTVEPGKYRVLRVAKPRKK